MNFGRQPQRILIVNDRRDAGSSYSPLFGQFGSVDGSVQTFKLNPFEYKLVVFTGGADISPELYGDTSPKGVCSCNPQRDKEEAEIFGFCMQRGIKMAGICRGMQFLNVMSGGKMVHHLDGHSSWHDIRTPLGGMSHTVRANSLHHQMAIPSTTTSILCWASERQSEVYIGDKDEPMHWPGPEVEAIYNSTYRILGVQWHPEALTAGHQARVVFERILREFLVSSTAYFKSRFLSENKVNIMGGPRNASV